MATYLQLVNSVLRRLREPEVATYNETEYSTLIGDFINDTKREVEDAHDWACLRQRITVNATASDYDYTLTGSGDRARFLRVINQEENIFMQYAGLDWFQNQIYNTGTLQSGAPSMYTVYGQDSSDDSLVYVWPVPDTSYTLYFDLIVPQADLAADATVLTIPSQPVILGAYARAVAERGEDGATSSEMAELRYRISASDAIAIDANRNPEYLRWEAV